MCLEDVVIFVYDLLWIALNIFLTFNHFFEKIKIILIIINDLNPAPRLIRGYSELRNNEKQN